MSALLSVKRSKSKHKESNLKHRIDMPERQTKYRKLGTVSIIVSSCGEFDKLPLEVLYLILEKLSLQEIGKLSVVSEAFRIKITDWMKTSLCLNRGTRTFGSIYVPGASLKKSSPYQNYPDNKAVILQEYLKEGPKLNELAILCKRVTCLVNTPERVRFSVEIFNGCFSRHKEILQGQLMKNEKELSNDWINAMHSIQFMRMLHTLTRGWDESEFFKVLKILDKEYQVTNRLFKISKAKNMDDVSLDLEMVLRMFFRSLLWEVVGSDFANRASWILATMKYFVGQNAKGQALIFLIAFGPSCDDNTDHYAKADTLTFDQRGIIEEVHNHTDWDAIVGIPPTNYPEGKKMFLTLAQAICACMAYSEQQHCENWKNNMLNDVLNSLFKTPNEWIRDNVAGFLLFCSENIILYYIGGMIETEEELEVRKAAILVSDMIIMSNRFENEFTSKKGMGKLLDRLCETGNGAVKLRFFEELWNAIKSHFDDIDDQDDMEEGCEILRIIGAHLTKKAFVPDNPNAAKVQCDTEPMEEEVEE